MSYLHSDLRIAERYFLSLPEISDARVWLEEGQMVARVTLAANAYTTSRALRLQCACELGLHLTPRRLECLCSVPMAA